MPSTFFKMKGDYNHYLADFKTMIRGNRQWMTHWRIIRMYKDK
jgi:hypothetical protein